MTALFLLLIAILPLSGAEPGAGNKNPEKEWLVTSQSSLTIAGTTNVNEFECVSLSYAGDDVLYEYRDPKSNKPVMNGLVILKASGFDCQNRIMTQDMQKTIQAERYPNIKVHFLSLQRSPLNAQKQKARGIVEVSLAGVSRQYEIEAIFEEAGNGKAYLKGSWEFTFTDFNMDPPTKMMGAIKVRDSLIVDFSLELKNLNSLQQGVAIGKL